LDKRVLVGVALVAVIAIIAAGIFAGGGAPEEAAGGEATATQTTQEVIVIKWATSKSTSAGYKAMSTFAQVVSREAPHIKIEPVATPGAVAGMKGFATGEYDACYAADVSLVEMYTGTGRFEGFEAQRLPLQTMWVYTLEIGIAVPADKADRYKCWSDLDGAKIFTLPLAWDVGVALRNALDALGINYEHVELDLDAVATALQRGDVVATGIYTSAGGRGLAAWEQQLFAQADLVVLNPCPEEIEKLKQAGIPVAVVGVDAFPEPVGADQFVGVKIYYGFHTGTNIPEEVVYLLLKILYENADELAQYDRSFSQVAEDMIGFQVEAIEALYAKGVEVPIHPGLAKFLKEHGAWNDEWKVAE